MKARTNPFLVTIIMIVAISTNTFGQSNNIPEGALNGLFSVSPSKQVYFSKGNLQYQASTNTWRFAEKQTAYIGVDNKNISENYEGWIDFFGWGTSGYPHGAVCYQPWSTSGNENDYCINGQITNNLSGKADWGYNSISNGGNVENLWRTLSGAEWQYLLYKRQTPSGIRFVYAKVNNTIGLIVLPDNWSDSYCELKNPNGNGSYGIINYFNEEEWGVLLESHGAAFLPASGWRSGTNPTFVGYNGSYWSTTRNTSPGKYSSPNDILFLFFTDEQNIFISGFNGKRYYGRSVRLVQDVK